MSSPVMPAATTPKTSIWWVQRGLRESGRLLLSAAILTVVCVALLAIFSPPTQPEPQQRVVEPAAQSSPAPIINEVSSVATPQIAPAAPTTTAKPAVKKAPATTAAPRVTVPPVQATQPPATPRTTDTTSIIVDLPNPEGLDASATKPGNRRNGANS